MGSTFAFGFSSITHGTAGNLFPGKSSPELLPEWIRNIPLLKGFISRQVQQGDHKSQVQHATPGETEMDFWTIWDY